LYYKNVYANVTCEISLITPCLKIRITTDADAAMVLASREVSLRTKGGMRDDTYLNVDWWGRIDIGIAN
jgi:hypothetical protein